MTKIQNFNPILVIVVVLVAGVLLGYFGSGQLNFGSLSKEEAGEKAINFVNQSIVQQGITASLMNVAEEGSLYRIHLKIDETGAEYDSYITKDGQLFFTSGINMEDAEEEAQEEETEGEQSEETGKEESAADLTAFAQCLTESGAKFYGSWWCPHCQNQKDLFGDSLQYVNYIECEKKPGESKWDLTQECQEAEITSLPTWEFADGTKETGELPLETLSELSGCSL